MAKNIDEFHAPFPKQPTIITETANRFSKRGIYKNDPEKGYVSSYDINFPGYAVSTEDWWKNYAEREFLAGGFDWTGFDYRGGPSPYKSPCISSQSGAMDTCGFPKDSYFYYQAWWESKRVLHLFPHWNWEGNERGLVLHKSRECRTVSEWGPPRVTRSEPQRVPRMECEVRARRARSARFKRWEGRVR